MTSMYTVCPKCALTLAVTAGDLRVAQGHVRCGRCSHVFNALTRLTSDDRQEEPQLKLTGSDTFDESLPEGVFEFNADASKVFADPLPAPKWTPTGTYRGSALRNETSHRNANDTSEMGAVEFDLTNDALTSATLETPVLKATPEPPAPMRRTVPPPRTVPPKPPKPPRTRPPEAQVTSTPTIPIFPQQQPPVFPQQQAPVPVSAGVWQPRRRRMPDPDEPLPFQRPARDNTRETSRETTARDYTREPSRETSRETRETSRDAFRENPRETSAPRQALVRQTSAPTSGRAAAQVDALLAAHAAKEARAVANFLSGGSSTNRNAQRYRVGAAALSVLLVVQIFNHYRNDLATHAALRGPLTTLYGLFGVTLVPHWDLTAYDVRQLGPAPARAGQITVRASIKNAGHQPQPMPVLRVTLQDRYGNQIGTRDVQPVGYLSIARRANAFMSAGERIDAEMALVDPGARAESFEIDACLPAPGGGNTCANDSAR